MCVLEGGGGPKTGEAISLFGTAGSCVSEVASKRTGGVVDNVFFCAVLSRHFRKQTGRVWGWGACVLVRGGLHTRVNRITSVDY